MPVQEKQRQHLIEKRARALAMMLLTHREDLRVEEVTDDIGLDYIVRFHTAANEGLREFGIELRGEWAAITREHADKVLRPSLQGMSRFSSLGCVPIGIGGVLSGSEPPLHLEDLTPSECELYFHILAVHDFPSHDHVFH